MPSKKSPKKPSAKKAAKKPKASAKKGKSSSGSKWLLKPPGPGEVRFSFSAHKSVKITPDVRAALENLAKALLKKQVEALGITAAAAKCGPDLNCGTKTIDCNVRGRCRPEMQNPCAIDYSCLIFPQEVQPLES